MKSKILTTALILVGILSTGYAQGVIGKLKQKADQAADRAIDRKINEKVGGNPSGTNQPGGTLPGSGPGGSGNPSNTSGGGLVVTPPDVKENMAEAESSFKAGRYSDARYSLKQAMLGVEMEIGNKVLKSLPESVVGLSKKADADQVTSMGYGWVGLTIHREYASGNKHLNVTIANNSAWISAANMYLSNTNYATTGGEQNWKQTKVKGYRGIIEYSQSSGYKLSVPIGQSSIIVWEGINFASEQDMMNAANVFDLDGIKNKLGEK
ncbi:MAG: hypothetical protein KF846_15905 [Cyclobacteriaceae bacterium]|nr:hypothetical protein [Cyclobacteriaceae bacterium]